MRSGAIPRRRPHEVPVPVGCSFEETRAMLALVHDILPAVDVLFEFSREAASVAVHGLRFYSIADIQWACTAAIA